VVVREVPLLICGVYRGLRRDAGNNWETNGGYGDGDGDNGELVGDVLGILVHSLIRLLCFGCYVLVVMVRLSSFTFICCYGRYGSVVMVEICSYG
jgi:hypothetical protein